MRSVDAEEQLRILSRISEEVIPETEFLEKLRRSKATGRGLRVKYGMDPTAPDIHLGNAIALHKLAVFQDLGHVPVIIVGDYTAMIGDPSGANKTRPILSREQVDANAETYLDQLGQIVDLTRAEVHRNGEWLGKLSFSEIVSLCSRITVARLVEREDFRKRLSEGSPVGVHELLYPIAQAFDSVVVNADVEIGGTDQKFNLLLARELQRMEGKEPQVVLTHPLLEGLDGHRKMSKSLGNYIGITESADEIFGKAMSIPDELMPRYFLWATDVPEEEYHVLLDAEQTHPRDAKEALARAVAARYHGAEDVQAAAERFKKVFSRGEEPEEMPTVAVESAEGDGQGGVWIVRLVREAGFASSNGEARRLVEQGAVTVDGAKVRDPLAHLALRGGETLRVGRRRFARVEMKAGPT